MIAAGSGSASADTVRQSEWWLAKLHILQAQQISQGSGVTIAVLSTGADSTAPDLAGSVTNGPDNTNSGRSAGGSFFGIQGTEVSSLIVGHGHGPNHADGILGVAPAAKILSIRVTLDSGDPLLNNSQIASGLPASIADGIRYAVKTGATVIQLPLDPAAESAGGTAGATELAGPSDAEKSAIQYAISKGAVVVAPAGDDGASTHAITSYPAAFPGVISVGAFDSAMNKAPFSARQPYVTITAAGSGVTAETPTGYTSVSSTAAAAAVVTGVVALVRSDFPALSVRQVTRALVTSTQFRHPHGSPTGSGFGVVDAMAALTTATRMAEPKGQAAGANSVPRMAPMAPAVTSNKATLAHKIERDALLSLAVLVALLALVGIIVLARRYRRGPRRPVQARPPPPADRPLLAPVAAGSQGGTPEYLPAPGAANGLASPGSIPPPGFEPVFGNGALAGRQAGLDGDSLGGGTTFPSAAQGGRHSAENGSRPRHGSRSVPSRARVNGRPPWEPAAKPDSELPWTAAPAPQARPQVPPPAPQQPAPLPPTARPAHLNGGNGSNGNDAGQGPINGYWAAPVLPGGVVPNGLAPSGGLGHNGGLSHNGGLGPHGGVDPNGRREFTGAQDLSPAHGGPPLPVRPPVSQAEADQTDAFPAFPPETPWPAESGWPTER